MRISIFGLGYVGCIASACLADNDHRIISVDISEQKVDLVNRGRPTIVEKDIDELIMKHHESGNISATTNFIEAVKQTDVSFICVGTPVSETGHLNMKHIFKVTENIAKGIKEKQTNHVIAVRSTVPPGTNKKIGEIITEITGMEKDKDFFVVSNPEFLREGSAIQDFLNPPFTLVGTDSDEAFDIMKHIYAGINGPMIRTDIKIAELFKYVNNSFHALKITFANEIGNVCKELGIDSHELMRIFCMDDKLNISPYYLKPGFAYGGSCLPKDLRALNTMAHDFYLEPLVLGAIEDSNEYQKKRLLGNILKTGKNDIGILGISFKAGTDDLRESPIVDVLEILIGKGKNVRVYDENVFESNLVGINKEFILRKIPHFNSIMSENLHEVIRDSEVIIINQKQSDFEKVFEYPGRIIIDLVRIRQEIQYEGIYDGFAW